MAVIHYCSHCRENCSKDFCRSCKTKEQRKAMCVEAQEIQKENGLGDYICPLDCLGLGKKKENKE